MRRARMLPIALTGALALCAPLAGALAVSAPAVAAGERGGRIRPTLLVAQPGELPGFRYAEREIQSADSPSRYASQILGDGPKEARKAAATLGRHGFREGVQEYFAALQGEALSIATVYSSAAGARWELAGDLRETPHDQGGSKVRSFSIAAIPGAVGLVELAASGPGGAVNVMFSSGRCFFLVGDALPQATTAEQLAAAPTAGAISLYRRNRRRCA